MLPHISLSMKLRIAIHAIRGGDWLETCFARPQVISSADQIFRWNNLARVPCQHKRRTPASPRMRPQLMFCFSRSRTIGLQKDPGASLAHRWSRTPWDHWPISETAASPMGHDSTSEARRLSVCGTCVTPHSTASSF